MAKFLEGKTAFLCDPPIVRIQALLTAIGNDLVTFLAAHQTASTGTLKAITICNVLETADLAFAAALETFEGHLLAPLLMQAI